MTPEKQTVSKDEEESQPMKSNKNNLKGKVFQFFDDGEEFRDSIIEAIKNPICPIIEITEESLKYIPDNNRNIVLKNPRTPHSIDHHFLEKLEKIDVFEELIPGSTYKEYLSYKFNLSEDDLEMWRKMIAKQPDYKSVLNDCFQKLSKVQISFKEDTNKNISAKSFLVSDKEGKPLTKLIGTSECDEKELKQAFSKYLLEQMFPSVYSLCSKVFKYISTNVVMQENKNYFWRFFKDGMINLDLKKYLVKNIEKFDLEEVKNESIDQLTIKVQKLFAQEFKLSEHEGRFEIQFGSKSVFITNQKQTVEQQLITGFTKAILIEILFYVNVMFAS